MHKHLKVIRIKIAAETSLVADLTKVIPSELAPLIHPVPVRHVTSAGVPKVIDYATALDVEGKMTITPSEAEGATTFAAGDLIDVLLYPGSPETLTSEAAE